MSLIHKRQEIKRAYLENLKQLPNDIQCRFCFHVDFFASKASAISAAALTTDFFKRVSALHDFDMLIAIAVCLDQLRTESLGAPELELICRAADLVDLLLHAHFRQDFDPGNALHVLYFASEVIYARSGCREIGHVQIGREWEAIAQATEFPIDSRKSPDEYVQMAIASTRKQCDTLRALCS